MPRRSRSQRDQPAKEESSRAQRDHELNVTINDLDYPQPAEEERAVKALLTLTHLHQRLRGPCIESRQGAQVPLPQACRPRLGYLLSSAALRPETAFWPRCLGCLDGCGAWTAAVLGLLGRLGRAGLRLPFAGTSAGSAGCRQSRCHDGMPRVRAPGRLLGSVHTHRARRSAAVRVARRVHVARIAAAVLSGCAGRRRRTSSRAQRSRIDGHRSRHRNILQDS